MPNFIVQVFGNMTGNALLIAGLWLLGYRIRFEKRANTRHTP